MKNKRLGVFILLVLLSGCHQQDVNYYDKGYEDAWDGKKNYWEYYFEPEYKKGYLNARSQIEDYRQVSSTMRQAQKDLGEAADDFSKSIEEMKKKVENWGKTQQTS